MLAVAHGECQHRGKKTPARRDCRGNGATCAGFKSPRAKKRARIPGEDARSGVRPNRGRPPNRPGPDCLSPDRGRVQHPCRGLQHGQVKRVLEARARGRGASFDSHLPLDARQ